jgi:ATP-dependent DNA helicase RecQ
MVFSDRTLKTLVRNRPDSTAALLRVHGIGDRKAEQYGEAVVTAIREFLSSGECPG